MVHIIFVKGVKRPPPPPPPVPYQDNHMTFGSGQHFLQNSCKIRAKYVQKLYEKFRSNIEIRVTAEIIATYCVYTQKVHANYIEYIRICFTIIYTVQY
jgi:hypothetical protein